MKRGTKVSKSEVGDVAPWLTYNQTMVRHRAYLASSSLPPPQASHREMSFSGTETQPMEDIARQRERARKVRNQTGRFRVLIIGRANAGKTTILQRVCNTTEEPKIFNQKGHKVFHVLDIIIYHY